MRKFINPQSTKLLITGALTLLLFYIFSFIVKEDLLHSFDFAMTVKIQSKIPIALDPYLSMLSLIGSFEGTLLILCLTAVVLRKIGMVVAIGMFCFMHVVELIGKAFLDHPGTPFMFHRYALDFVFPSGYVQPGGSYPSGHAMRTAFLTIMFMYLIHKAHIHPKAKLALRAAVLLIYILMAISRVSLGEHWTTDVIGGSLLGAAFLIFSLIFI